MVSDVRKLGGGGGGSDLDDELSLSSGLMRKDELVFSSFNGV